MIGPRALDLLGFDGCEAKVFSKAAQDAIAANRLGYALIVAVED